MKRGILVLIAVLAFVFGQSYTPNCESTDVYFLYDNFDGSNTYAQDISYSAFGGPNVRMGVAFPTLNDLTADENEFQNQISIAGGIPLTVAGLEAAVEKLVEQSPAENRRILFVVEYHNSFNPQSNILSVANRIKQNATYPIEIAVISAYGASNKNFYDFDLASGPSHVVDDTTSSSDEVTLKALRILSGINSTYCSAIGSRVSTFDGSSFSFNGLGDFWLYRANFLQVQARLAPCNDDEPTRTTCIRSVAINYDGDRFEFSIDPISNQPIYISGGSVEPLTSNNVYYDSGAVYTLNLPGFDTPFTTIEVQYGDYYLTLVYGNGLGFTVTLRTSIYDLGRSRGLCGTFDGCRDNDFYSVNQVYINPTSSAADIYNGFADTWRVDSNDALFEYGINQQYYYPNYPEYTKEWNPIMGLSGVSETAATNCGFFSDKSKYFYDVCTEAYSRTMEHGAAVRGVALFQLAQTCADFCASGRLDNPIVDFTYCKNTCPIGNELDLHKVDYDATNIPHLLQTSQWGSKFQTALGGTYTLELQSSFCYQPQINVTINVVCESSPSVNAGSDRTIRRINQNVNPSVVLQATATDVNTQHLQYSWKLIEYPAFDNDTWEKLGLQFNTAPVLDQNTHQIVYDFLFLNEASITYNSPILYLEHNIFVAGQWVWEVAVFDGCSIVRDNVTLNYVCETCDAIATYPITDINYKNNGYTNTASHQFDEYSDGGHAVNGGASFTTIVDNSNNFEMEYLSATNILFYTYHNNFINTTTEVVNGNTTGTPVPTSHPILSNFRFTRTEGSDFILTTTDTFTTTTIITEYYDALSNITEKCQIRITNSDNDSGSIQVTNEWEWDQADMFDGAVHNCLGDYNIRTSYHDVNCGGTIDSYQNLRVNCSTSPIAHLITCQNTINYDYNTNSWPTVELDGSDSKDFDVTETLFYRYEITSQPALGSNDQYITCNAPGNTIVAGSNRIYANCPQTTTFVPSWPGDYTVKLTVGDGCTYSSETTTIRAVCENITPTLALTYIPDSRNTTNPTFYTLVANTTVATENPVIYSYRFVSIPTGAPEPNPMQTTYSPVSEFSADLYLGGSYTVEVMVSDGCWTQGVNRTFTYTCATAPALSGVTATASNWEDLGFGAFGYSTSTISATIAYSPAGRTGLVTIDLVSQPADSTQSFSQQSFSNTPTWNFAPTRPGSYIFQITANDGCSVVSRNVTLTTTCPALSAAFSIDQATYVWNGTDAVTVVLTATDGSTQPGIIYSYSIQSPEPETAPIVINTQVVNFNLVDYIGVWTVTLTVFDGCSTRNVTRTFTVNCQWTLSVNTIAAQTKVYGNNRFDRVTFVPTFTTNYPDEWNYAYVWDVRSAPVDSLFAPYNTTVNEFVGTTTNTVGPVQVSSDPDIWTITTTEVIETRRVNTVRYVTLANGIAAENYAVCFSPDLSGTYTARIQVLGYCAGQIATQTATLTANCNDAPVANAGEDRTVTFQGVNTGSTYVSFNGTATDANNDKLSHSWSIVSVPADSMIIVNDSASRLRNQDSLLSGFLPDVAGAYTLQLTVTDGCSTSTDTVTITVACNNNFTIPQSMVRQTQNFDGYTPVAFREFNIVATPQCDRDFQWTLTHFVPTPIVPPPTPEPQPQPTAGASQVAASLLAILALIALLL